MKKLFRAAITTVLVLCPLLISAQNSKKKVTSASDLPRYGYDMPENLNELATDEAAYRAFAARIRLDLEGVLRDYDIEDKPTLKSIHSTLGELDLQDGRLDSALEHFRRVLDLEEKPELRYLPEFFDSQVIAKARLRSGAESGEKFLQALRQVVTETLNAMPGSLLAGIKQYRFVYDLIDNNFLKGVIQQQFAGKSKKSGNKLFGADANGLVGIWSTQKYVVPVTGEMAQLFDTYIAAHNTAQVNIWPARSVDLRGRKELSPVIAAVWDTGVDPSVFPGRMFINPKEKLDGKDNDHNGYVDDIHGIGFLLNREYTSEPLFPIKPEDAKKYGDWIREDRVFQKLQEAVDDEETRALKEKLRRQTPAEVAEEIRLADLFRHYAHGTQVAAVIIEGNPAVRILSARRTWRDASGQNDSVAENVEYARRFATNIQQYVDYFKKQNVRVVNMSWSLSRIGIEENLAKNTPNMTPEERRREADESFAIIKNALFQSFRSASEILFVTSAGNTNSDAAFSESIPSSLELPNLLTVGSVDERGAAASTTSFGRSTKLYAQGVRVPAVIPGGEKLLFSGTSAAAPQVANLAAKLIAITPTLKVAEIVRLVTDGADLSEADNRLRIINPKRSVKLLETR